MLVNAPKRIAPDVAWHPVGHVNVYFIGRPGSDWVLVDTGTPGHAEELYAAAQARFGKSPPVAIVLTHGHFDHSGNALELAQQWRVPVYAHRLELPYLTGHSPYPPQDPLVGGFLGIISVFVPDSGTNLAEHVRELPAQIPTLPDWRWLHTPGHSPGHISLFRERDRTLISGDALATVNMEHFRDLMKQTPELSGGPMQFNCDWPATIDSVRRLAQLQPQVIAAGHGVPMSGPEVPNQLTAFAETFAPPARGRYVAQPARTDESGIVSVPAPASFAWLRVGWRAIAATVGTLGAFVGAGWMLSRWRKAHR